MATRDFLQNAAGGMAIVNGDFALIADYAAVSQGIGIRLRLIRGEVFTDETQGVDYLGSINIKNPDPLVVRALLTEQIAATPDVTSVVGAGLVGPDANRNATIQYQVATTYSTQPLVGQVQTP